MEFIRFNSGDESKSIIGSYYNRKMFGNDTIHKSGEWKSIINYKDLYHLMLEDDGFVSENTDKSNACIICPIGNETISGKVFEETGTLNFILILLFIIYFLKCFKIARDKFIFYKSK